MDLVQTITNAVVLGAVGLIMGAMVRGVRSDLGRFRAEVRADVSELRREFGELRTEVRSDVSELGRELGELRTEVRADLSEVRKDIREFRSDLTQVALAVGARPPAGRGP